MSYGWENHEPAPLEFFHGRLMDLFHELRKEHGGTLSIDVDGIALSNLIAKAKTETYKKYPKQVSPDAILKTDL